MIPSERNVVGHDRVGKALEGERANLFGYDASLERDIDPLTEQNLAVLGLSTKTGGDIAWKAQEQLCRRYRKLARAGKPPTVNTAAIARELAGFVWAIAKQAQPVGV